VVAGRFEIVEALTTQIETRQYRARDLGACAACGYDDNEPGEEFCRACGALLAEPAFVTITENISLAPQHVDDHLTAHEHDFFVVREPLQTPGPAAEPEQANLRLAWGCKSDTGIVRDHNEDALDVRLYVGADGSKLGLFVVADGLGGQDSGEVASQMAITAVWEALRERVWEPFLRGERPTPEEIEMSLSETVCLANAKVYAERTSRNSEMSSTLTLALVVGDAAYIANVGDSRTYAWGQEGLVPITRDHSLVQRLVETGQISAEEVYTHPRRNIVYQSIGDRPEVQPDVYRRELAADGCLILCSDGLWEMVRTEGLEEVLLAEPDPQRACERLVRDANLAGGEDNITVIIVKALAS
jgi:protein phosphatase